MPASQVFAVGDLAPAVTASSSRLRSACARWCARVTAEIGSSSRAGPIGQAVCLAARDAVARVPGRLARAPEHARALGAQEVVCGDAADVAGQARERAGGDGVPVMIETTACLRWSAGPWRFARRRVGWCSSRSPTRRSASRWATSDQELDVLGVSCNASEFAMLSISCRHEAAVARLITDEFAFEQAPEASSTSPAVAELMKAVGQVVLAGSQLSPQRRVRVPVSRPSHLARGAGASQRAPRRIPLHA